MIRNLSKLSAGSNGTSVIPQPFVGLPCWGACMLRWTCTRVQGCSWRRRWWARPSRAAASSRRSCRARATPCRLRQVWQSKGRDLPSRAMLPKGGVVARTRSSRRWRWARPRGCARSAARCRRPRLSAHTSSPRPVRGPLCDCLVSQRPPDCDACENVLPQLLSPACTVAHDRQVPRTGCSKDLSRANLGSETKCAGDRAWSRAWMSGDVAQG